MCSGIRARKSCTPIGRSISSKSRYRGGSLRENPFGGNEFGRENVGAVFFGRVPEDFVRDAAMGAKIQRKAFENQGRQSSLKAYSLKKSCSLQWIGPLLTGGKSPAQHLHLPKIAQRFRWSLQTNG